MSSFFILEFPSYLESIFLKVNFFTDQFFSLRSKTLLRTVEKKWKCANYASDSISSLNNISKMFRKNSFSANCFHVHTTQWKYEKNEIIVKNFNRSKRISQSSLFVRIQWLFLRFFLKNITNISFNYKNLKRNSSIRLIM